MNPGGTCSNRSSSTQICVSVAAVWRSAFMTRPAPWSSLIRTPFVKVEVHPKLPELRHGRHLLPPTPPLSRLRFVLLRSPNPSPWRIHWCSLFAHLGTSGSSSSSMTPASQAGVPKLPQPLSAACSLAEVRIALAIAVALAMSHAGRIPSIRKDRYVCSGAIGRLPAKSNQLLGRHHPITSVRERFLGLRRIIK